MSAVEEFLTAWTLARTDLRPLSHEEADEIAAQWCGAAGENGIDPDALSAAAGGDIAAYLLRTYGEVGQGLSTDQGDHSGDQIHPPPEHDEIIGLFS